MNNEFIKHFVSSLLFNLATIVGYIVGVTVWITNRVSDWYNSGGRDTLLKYTQRVLLFITSSTEKAYYGVCDVTLSELSH
jgi:hypothetical protein